MSIARLSLERHKTLKPIILELQKELKDLPIRFFYGNRNFTQNLHMPNVLVIDVHTSERLQEVQSLLNYFDIVTKKLGTKLFIRFAAGGNTFPGRYSHSYSLSPLIDADINVRMNGLAFSEIKALKKWITVVRGNQQFNMQLVKVGPNVKIKQLDEFLYKKFGLVTATSPYVAWTTINGSLATGANGTGQNWATVCDTVYAMKIRRLDNTLVTIDGDAKILDYPDGSYEFYGQHEYVHFNCAKNKLTTIKGQTKTIKQQQAEVKKQASAEKIKKIATERQHLKNEFMTIKSNHFGVFGAVEELTIACLPAQKLECRLRPMTFAQFKEEIAQGLLRKYAYTSFSILPNYEANPSLALKNRVMVMTWQPVPLSTPDVNYSPGLNNLTEQFQVLFSEVVQLPRLLKTFSGFIPMFIQYFASKVRILNQETRIVGPWYEIAHRTNFPKNINTNECYIPLKGAPTADGVYDQEVIQALEYLEVTLLKYAARKEYPMIYEIFGRFLANRADAKSLGATFSSDYEYVLALDCPTGYGIKGSDKFLAEIEAYFCQQMGAHPHPGKQVYFRDGDQDINPRDVYGELIDNFNAVARKWYQDANAKYENSPFVNPYLRFLFLQGPRDFKQDKLSEYTPAILQQAAIKMKESLLRINGNEPHSKALIHLLGSLDRIIHYHFPSSALRLNDTLNRSLAHSVVHSLSRSSMTFFGGVVKRMVSNSLRIGQREHIPDAARKRPNLEM